MVKAEIIGKDGVIRTTNIPPGASEFRFQGNAYIVRPSAAKLRPGKIIPIPRRIYLYFEGIPEPIEWHGQHSSISGQELDAIIGAKVLRDIGKAGFNIPVKAIVYGIIAISIIAGVLMLAVRMGWI